MSYKIDYSKDKVIATFGEKIKESEITETFIEIIDTINIININAIIFDCSKTIDYTSPADYMSRVLVLTRFSTTWNSKLDFICVTTNKEIILMMTDIMNHDQDLKWKYLLFEKKEEALQFLNKN
jgi:hypothetical protein